MIAELLASALLGRRLGPGDPQTGMAEQAPIPRGVVVREGRLIPWLGGKFGGMAGPASAVTLGRTIVVYPGVALTPLLLSHELAHVRQWQTVPLFPLRYALATLRYGYMNNPYEVEARTLAASDHPARSADQRSPQHG